MYKFNQNMNIYSSCELIKKNHTFIIFITFGKIRMVIL